MQNNPKRRPPRWPTRTDASHMEDRTPQQKLERARAFILEGDFERALHESQRVLRLDPDHYFALNLHGYCQAKLQRWSEALATYQHAAKTAPQKAEPLFYISRIHTHEMKLDEALTFIDQAIAVEPAYSEAWFWRAYILDLADRYPEAELAYRAYLDINPSDPISLMNLGRMLNRLGRQEESAGALQKAVELDPALQVAWYELAETFAALVEITPAIEAYQRSLQLVPGHVPSLVGRGWCQWQLAQVDLAMADFNSALELDSGYWPALQHRARLRSSLGQSAEALADCETALQQVPDHYEMMYISARSLREIGQLTASIKRWKALEALYPGDTYALMGLSISYESKGHKNLAIEACTRAIEAGPTYMLPYTRRGYFRFLSGDYEGARADYEAALQKDPSYTATYNNYVVLLFAQKQYAEGLAMLERAQQVKPDMDYTCYNFGCYYAIHGEHDLALSWLEKAFALSESLRAGAWKDPDLDSLHESERFQVMVGTRADASSTHQAEAAA